MDRIRNEEDLDRIRETRTLWKHKKRRAQIIVHTLRHKRIAEKILENEVEKKNDR